MIIDFANVGKASKMIEVEFQPAEIEVDRTVSLEGTVLLKGDAYLANGRVAITATIETDVSVDCVRCLEPVASRLVAPFVASFVDADSDAASSEKEVAGEQLDESVVQDGKIDLRELAREQILLAIPEQTFCKDDCKGLCQQCGANLNLIDCKCADDEIDPRWAALKNLK